MDTVFEEVNGEMVELKRVVSHAQHGIIEKVNRFDDGDWSIETNGCGCFCLFAKHEVEPKVGDKVTLHVYQGSMIRGLSLNDKEVFYKTDLQLNQYHAKMVAKMEQEAVDKFEAGKEKLDSDFAALPAVFQKRIQRFRDESASGKYRVKYEDYDMFTCNQAVVIQNALKTTEAIDAWSKLESTEQRAAVPALDEGHSGNTFNCSMRLAYWYADFLAGGENVAKAEEAIIQSYGALAPLVGTDAYRE